jgi:hypothetical protein
MNVTIGVDDYDNNHVFFQDSVKNNIMNDSDFIRIIYSNSLFMLNGIFINFKISSVHIEKYFNKYKCTFVMDENENEIKKICNIEKNILDKIGIIGKTPIFKITEQLMSSSIKLFTENLNKCTNKQFILKMSGIWENEMEYGITYKFMDV